MRRILLVILMVALGACSSTQTRQEPASVGQAPEPLENMIRWSTASEVDNFGYDVFRGMNEDGPFSRLNAAPIPGSGTTDIPQKYEYRDATIEPNTAYYYYVESISLQGERERFTPVFRSRPKGN